MSSKIGRTHIALWNGRKPHIAAILNNRPTSTMKIHIHIFAIMHSNLSRGNNKDTIFDPRNMSSASHVPSYDQRVLDIFEREAGEWCIGGSRDGHIDDTSIESRDGA